VTAWVYLQSKVEELWTVGFYKPDGKWEPESDHSTPGEAAARVNYLNGGQGESNPNHLSGAELERAEQHRRRA